MKDTTDFDPGLICRLVTTARAVRGNTRVVGALRSFLPGDVAARLMLPRSELAAAKLTVEQQRGAVAALRALL